MSALSGKPLWARGEALGLPSLEDDIEADVCVVGLGASGLVCVKELARLGARVLGVDAGEVGGAAAGRNGGFLLAGVARFYHDAVSAYGHTRAQCMYRLSLDEIDRIAADEAGTVSLVGSLRIAESDEELEDCRQHLLSLRADEFPVEHYDDEFGRGLLLPSDGAFDPLERCRVLARAAIDAGARLFERSHVTTIRTGRVDTATGVVHARHVVVAVDGALGLLLPQLAGDVRTARLQMLATAPTTEITQPRPIYARWGYDYWQQRPDGAIALGGARDIGGDSEWTHDTAPSHVVQSALEHRLRAKLRVMAPITHRWGASVSYTADELPIVREVDAGVWAIGGYSGTGNVIGSLLGRGVARLIVRSDDTLLRPFRRPS